MSAKQKLFLLRSRGRFFSCYVLVLLLLSFPLSARADMLEDAVRGLALSLDCQTIANMLLQKQAELASALLPQWLSGYAFLFTMVTNFDRAKETRATLPAGSPGAKP